MLTWPVKDPDEVLDYQFDWTERLDTGETITASTMLVASGDVVIDSNDIAGAITTVWLSAGTHGVNNVITNRITTSEARVYEESARVRVRSSAP